MRISIPSLDFMRQTPSKKHEEKKNNSKMSPNFMTN